MFSKAPTVCEGLFVDIVEAGDCFEDKGATEDDESMDGGSGTSTPKRGTSENGTAPSRKQRCASAANGLTIAARAKFLKWELDIGATVQIRPSGRLP